MRVLVTFFALLGMLSLTACNTVRGVGQDIEKAGETIQKAGSR
ncbi:MAG: entericidin A/B family lipoprotein [Thiobacillaceae bacterium]|jgi:predicted small secreted protein